MKQRTLAMMTGFEQYTRKTRRAIFLEEMEQVVPWRELCALVAPHYPKPGNGRPPVGVERMLRIYFLQQWFNLSDPAVEEALYDSGVMRQFVGIDLGCEPVPDETTVCKFRHLLEQHQLGEQILGQVNLHLQAQGVRITTGTIVDATILHAPVKRHLVCKRWTIEKADENSNGIPWFVLHRPNSDKLRFHLPSLPWHWFDA